MIDDESRLPEHRGSVNEFFESAEMHFGQYRRGQTRIGGIEFITRARNILSLTPSLRDA
jgi:hypothetical protein